MKTRWSGPASRPALGFSLPLPLGSGSQKEKADPAGTMPGRSKTVFTPGLPTAAEPERPVPWRGIFGARQEAERAGCPPIFLGGRARPDEEPGRHAGAAEAMTRGFPATGPDGLMSMNTRASHCGKRIGEDHSIPGRTKTAAGTFRRRIASSACRMAAGRASGSGTKTGIPISFSSASQCAPITSCSGASFP